MTLNPALPISKLAAKIVAKARDDAEVIGVAVYGSVARKESSPMSDVDICIFLKPRRYQRAEMCSKRMEYLRAAGSEKADVQLFQQLPLAVRSMVLKEGKLVFVRDERALYGLAFETIRDLEYFRVHYEEYLAGIVDAESKQGPSEDRRASRLLGRVKTNQAQVQRGILGVG